MSRTYHTSTKIYRTNRSLVWLSVVLLGISPTSAFAQTISVYPDSRSNSPAPPGNTVTNQSTITTSSSNTSSSTAFQIGDGSAKPSRQAAVSKATQLDAATPKKLEDGTTDSAGTNRTDSVTADKADSPPPLSDNQADTKPASPTPVDINANTPSKLDTIEVSAHQPQWKTTLSDGNETFLRVLEAISGRPNNEETCSLLKGVVKITKLENKFEFLRQDEEALELDASTKLGSNMLRFF